VSLRSLRARHAPPSCLAAGLLEDFVARDTFTRKGYDVVYELTDGDGRCPPASPPRPGTGYLITAKPAVPGRSGRRKFHMDATGVIRAWSGGTEAAVDVGLAGSTEGASGMRRLPQPEQVTLKDTVILKSSVNPARDAIRFDHRAHLTRAPDCSMCHHAPKPERPQVSAFQPCSSCHDSVIRAPMRTDRRRAFHQVTAVSGLCIDCHKAQNRQGRQAPVRCAQCHAVPNR
jgi:hypothetical protein